MVKSFLPALGGSDFEMDCLYLGHCTVMDNDYLTSLLVNLLTNLLNNDCP